MQENKLTNAKQELSK